MPLHCVIAFQDFVGADGSDDNSTIKNPESVESVAKILQLENAEELSFAFTTLRTETRGMYVLLKLEV